MAHIFCPREETEAVLKATKHGDGHFNLSIIWITFINTYFLNNALHDVYNAERTIVGTCLCYEFVF